MTIRIEQRADGELIAVVGASRSGKTAWVKQCIANAPRVLVRDPRGEFVAQGFERCQTPAELARALRDAGQGKARIAYWGPDDGWPAFCDMAYAWAMLWPAVIVAEEVADVTSPGKAAGAWGELVRKGLYYGAHIYAVTQRPQECDKSVFGNATRLHVHKLISPADQRYMAERLAVPPEQVAGLERLEYIERRAGDDDVKKGRVTFR